MADVRTRGLGALALVVGVVGAVALWLAAERRYDEAVADLAPAPIGCDTTLAFERSGTYTFFVETRGEVGDIDGDCESDDRRYDAGGETPDVALVLVDGGGDEVDLDPASGPSYERDGSSGVGIGRVRIDDPGDYVLTVSADDAEAMVRVGRDPSSGVLPMRLGALGVLVAGVTLFVIALLAGRRPRPEPGAPAGGPAWPAGWPSTPPVAPPYANPPARPPYAAPSPPGPGGQGGGRPLPPPTLPPPTAR